MGLDPAPAPGRRTHGRGRFRRCRHEQACRTAGSQEGRTADAHHWGRRSKSRQSSEQSEAAGRGRNASKAPSEEDGHAGRARGEDSGLSLPLYGPHAAATTVPGTPPKHHSQPWVAACGREHGRPSFGSGHPGGLVHSQMLPVHGSLPPSPRQTAVAKRSGRSRCLDGVGQLGGA